MIDEQTRQQILEKRYLLKGESEDEMYWRVASYIGDDEREIKQFYRIMSKHYFLPNSPTLMNAGTDNPQLSACFVLPVGDSMEEIFDAVKYAAIVHKTGGGTGFSFSRLRPNGDIVNGTNGVASGVVSFMKVFDAATEQVKQGGKRRGANMGVLDVHHPDIEEFITAKWEEGVLKNFNISVAVTDVFMMALQNNDNVKLINPRNKEITKEVHASKLFDLIARGIWRNGEPGVIFIDRVNKEHTCNHLGKIEATNPCSEVPLLDYESCNLGSINLAKFVENGKFNYDKLEQVVRIAVRFLDKVIDKNKYPLKQIEKATKRTRKIGLGVMGWADALLMMSIPYDSKMALDLASDVMGFIERVAVDESSILAEEFGTFPAWEGSKWYEQKIPIRNATLTTIAPTGTISMIARCSSGIEPIFNFVYKRSHIIDEDVSTLVVHPLFRKAINNDSKLIDLVYREGTTQLPEMPDDIAIVFKGALDIHWTKHIDIVAAFQKFTHNGISKTINMPNTTTIDDIKQAIIYAYRKGCKGITIYREGSRQYEVLSTGRKELKRRTRPKKLRGTTYVAQSGCGKIYVTINKTDDGVFEVFIPSIQGCVGNTEGVARLISLALRAGVDVKEVVEQLKKIKCPNALRNKAAEGKSCPDIIAKFIEEELGNQLYDNSPKCPDCGSKLGFGEGCGNGICKVCGWSGCL